jgi:hypothetical protein
MIHLFLLVYNFLNLFTNENLLILKVFNFYFSLEYRQKILH